MFDFAGHLVWINIIFALIVIFTGKKSAQSTLMWVMVLYFLPGIGFLFYLMFGLVTRKDRRFTLKEYQDRALRLQTMRQLKQISSDTYSFEDMESEAHKELIRMNLALDESFYTENNEAQIFTDGEHLFHRMMEDLKSAQHSIDIQYYIFKADKLGKEILGVLEERAKAGVEVRFLVDALGSRWLLNRHVRPIVEAGGHFDRFFKSFFYFFNFRMNYRNHRKIVIIDNKIGYVGGFNVGDEYVGKKNLGDWRDTHVRLCGDAVFGLKLRFAKDWCYVTKEDPVFLDSLIGMNKKMTDPGDVAMQIVTSGPDTVAPNIKNAILKMIMVAKKEIYIQTPYFVPDESIMDALRIALNSGIRVKIMIPAKKDHPFVFWANLYYVGELLKLGAEIYYYHKGFLHAKTVIVDDFLSTVGSANMDIRSFDLNFEVNAIFYDNEINRRLRAEFAEDIKHATQLTEELYSSRSRRVKVFEAFSRLLSPIL